jgi:hypothetical protein
MTKSTFIQVAETTTFKVLINGVERMSAVTTPDDNDIVLYLNVQDKECKPISLTNDEATALKEMLIHALMEY